MKKQLDGHSGLEPDPLQTQKPTVLRTTAAFFAGVLFTLITIIQYASWVGIHFNVSPPGTPEWHEYPMPSPTNAFPSAFPSSLGSPGATRAAAEPGIAATAPAYPLHSGSAQLVPPPQFAQGDEDGKFDIFRHWGCLSPWYSVGRGAFGVDSSPEVPDTCRITGVHLLYRHGARYPADTSSTAGPATFAAMLREHSNVTFSGPLSFLNDWTYKLGEEGLTPFGRAQLFDLGVSMRMRYGFLLKNFTEANALPVFRTESQVRMLASAQNFALGFFGYPLENQYQQLIYIAARGFNSTLASYRCCPNNDVPERGWRGVGPANEWTDNYLRDAAERLQEYASGVTLTTRQLFLMQQTCAYETVALGYSKFCELFTEEEWEGFDYADDVNFWYGLAFGSPMSNAMGIGYVQELVSRLTETPIETHNSSTNATLHNPLTFPFGQSLYVDATHEVGIINVLTALGLSSLAATGPLPVDHIPESRSFKTSEVAPYAGNIQFQLLACDSEPGPQIRVILNDGVLPLSVLKGCRDDHHGMCSVEAFVEAQREHIRAADWNFVCNGDWEVPEGWNTTSGYPDWI